MKKIISLSIPEAMSSHHLVTFIFACIVATLNISIHTLYKENRYGSYFETFFTSDLLFGIILISMPFIGKLIINRVYIIVRLSTQIANRETFDQLEASTKRRFNKSLGSYFLPIITAITGVFPILSTTGLPWVIVINQQIYKIFLFVFFTFIGSLGWYYLAFLITLHKIDLEGIKGRPFKSLTSKIKKINRYAMDIFATGFILYALAIIGISTIPPSGEWIFEIGPVGSLWVIPMASAVFLYFSYTQYRIHLLLVAAKESRLEKIDKLIKKTFSQPSGQRDTVMDLLFKLRAIGKDEPEWPLDITATATIIGGILIPAIGTIKELLTK